MRPYTISHGLPVRGSVNLIAATLAESGVDVCLSAALWYRWVVTTNICSCNIQPKNIVQDVGGVVKSSSKLAFVRPLGAPRRKLPLRDSKKISAKETSQRASRGEYSSTAASLEQLQQWLQTETAQGLHRRSRSISPLAMKISSYHRTPAQFSSRLVSGYANTLCPHIVALRQLALLCARAGALDFVRLY